MDFLKDFFIAILHKKEIKEETTETKKCIRCLRRIKISHYKCPYCGTTNFIYDT
jgi:predicted RNA-binding Zn-ribbon protein involved in translation (DUF1610 family)